MNNQNYNAPVPPQPPQPPQSQGNTAVKNSNNSVAIAAIVTIGAVIITALIVVAVIFVNKSKYDVKPVTTFIYYNQEQDFNDIEKEFRGVDGKVPEGKRKAALDKDCEYLKKYNSTTNTFKSIKINETNEYIECVLNDGGVYCHYLNGKSYYEDDKGNKTYEDDEGNEDTSDASETTTETTTEATTQQSMTDLLTSDEWVPAFQDTETNIFYQFTNDNRVSVKGYNDFTADFTVDDDKAYFSYETQGYDGDILDNKTEITRQFKSNNVLLVSNYTIGSDGGIEELYVQKGKYNPKETNTLETLFGKTIDTGKFGEIKFSDSFMGERKVVSCSISEIDTLFAGESAETPEEIYAHQITPELIAIGFDTDQGFTDDFVYLEIVDDSTINVYYYVYLDMDAVMEWIQIKV